MPQMAIYRTNNSFFAYSFTTGVVQAKTPQRLSEDDAVARAMYLARTEGEEAADFYLEQYLAKTE